MFSGSLSLTVGLHSIMNEYSAHKCLPVYIYEYHVIIHNFVKPLALAK